MLKKRAQGLSLRVLVITAILLVVLIVLIIIFLSNSSSFRKEVENCNTNGGTCTFSRFCRGTPLDAKCTTGEIYVPTGWSYSLLSDRVVCCVELK